MEEEGKDLARVDVVTLIPATGSNAGENEVTPTSVSDDQQSNEPPTWAGYPLTWGDEG